jgi:hypothetical protein
MQHGQQLLRRYFLATVASEKQAAGWWRKAEPQTGKVGLCFVAGAAYQEQPTMIETIKRFLVISVVIVFSGVASPCGTKG